MPLFTPLALPFEPRVEREADEELTGENMQGFLPGGGGLGCSSSSLAASFQQPSPDNLQNSHIGMQTSQAFYSSLQYLGVQVLVRPEIDGGNLISAWLDVLSSLDMQNMEISPGGIETMWTSFFALQA